jgi:plasmid replication initiation protein
MAASPYEILAFTGRGVSARDHHRLKAALDRLQSTTGATGVRFGAAWCHRPTERPTT